MFATRIRVTVRSTEHRCVRRTEETEVESETARRRAKQARRTEPGSLPLARRGSRVIEHGLRPLTERSEGSRPDGRRLEPGLDVDAATRDADAGDMRANLGVRCETNVWRVLAGTSPTGPAAK